MLLPLGDEQSVGGGAVLLDHVLADASTGRGSSALPSDPRPDCSRVDLGGGRREDRSARRHHRPAIRNARLRPWKADDGYHVRVLASEVDELIVFRPKR